MGGDTVGFTSLAVFLLQELEAEVQRGRGNQELMVSAHKAEVRGLYASSCFAVGRKPGRLGLDS